MTTALDAVAGPHASVWVTFRGEERLNAFSRATWEELDALVADWEGDHDLRAVVLTGAGRAFVAGADIHEYLAMDAAGFGAFQRRVREVTDRLVALPVPVIAAVGGFALGGGFELALACDVIVAADRARFGLPEAKLGLLPGGGGTQRLPRLVGPLVAKELLITGRIIDAAEAHRLGLVNRVVAADRLHDTVAGLLEEIADCGPLAVRTATRLVDDGLDLPLGRALDLEAERMVPLFDTADAAEGLAAFAAKRAPRFEGR